MVGIQKLFFIALFVLSVLSLMACDKTTPHNGQELARINGHVITLEEFEQEMERLSESAKLQMISEEGRRKFLQELISQELLLQEAKKKGLHENKEILANVAMFKKGLIINALGEELCLGKDEVSDEEVEAYYRSNKKEFVLEQVWIRHILLKTLEEAKEIKKRLLRGEDFITLTKQYSIWMPTKMKGGDLGYIKRGMVHKSFEEAAFALKKQGDLSDIVKTEFGYNIIRLEDKIGPRQLTFPEVQEEIRNNLRKKKREKILTAYLQNLREKAQIHIYEALLAAEEEEEVP
ncbi:MAG: peptidylprolyl isomerase [Deltaproteobacteria bacterium]|nr:peptidylprolyl isomerase [Deltaproteobacteria bacterium]